MSTALAKCLTRNPSRLSAPRTAGVSARRKPATSHPAQRMRTQVVEDANSSFWWPLALSTMAGLSTSVGGALAVIRKPSQGAMAGLLGIAIGVMATISLVELIIKNAMENDPFLVVASAMGGGLAYYLLEPFFPKVEEEDFLKVRDVEGVDEDDIKQREPLISELSGDADASRHTAGGLRKKVRKAVVSGPALTSTTMQADPDPEAGLMPGSHSNGTGASHGLYRTAHGPHGPDASSQALPETPRPFSKQGSVVPQQGSPDKLDTTLSVISLRDQAIQGDSSGGGDGGGLGAGPLARAASGSLGAPRTSDGSASTEDAGAGGQQLHTAWLASGAHTPHSASLMRLGLLMATTMTLHNMPEGFAVAFSAFTDFGPVMAVAIALHNIPEGIIIAAPIYAATGSRWKAMGLATASGLSEPLGAVLALVLLHPFITPERLQYLLACVGGLMVAVCVIELWPEARACRNDRALALGAIGGSLVMGWTLAVQG